MKMKKMLVSLATVSLLVAGAGTAFAEEECDCPTGMECAIEVIDLCPALGIVCLDEDEGDCVTDEHCGEPYESQICVPVQCESNSDCSGDTVCMQHTYGSCGGSDCAPGDECDEEPECEEFSQAYCVPPYVAPCQVDADCGAGFYCEEAQEDCPVSSDGDEVGCGSGVAAEGEGQKICVLIAVACEEDTDCEGELICLRSAGGFNGCPDVLRADGDDGIEDPNDSGCEVEEEEVAGYCAPAGYEDYFGGVKRSSRGCSASGGQVPPAGLIGLVAVVWGLVRRRKA